MVARWWVLGVEPVQEVELLAPRTSRTSPATGEMAGRAAEPAWPAVSAPAHPAGPLVRRIEHGPVHLWER